MHFVSTVPLVAPDCIQFQTITAVNIMHFGPSGGFLNKLFMSIQMSVPWQACFLSYNSSS